MKYLPVFFAALFLSASPILVASPAAADLRAEIDLSDQRLRVYVNGWLRHEWKISTARRGYRTPVGNYRPIRLERTWYSRKYDLAPMPYSVFFHGGYAIHGTGHIKGLGRPASHGCIRLHPDNAARLYSMVQQYGAGNTSIRITQ